MNTFIIGPSRSAKTPITLLIAKSTGWQPIHASDWVRSIFLPSRRVVTIEDKQVVLEEITAFSQRLLQENPNRCIDYIRSNNPHLDKYSHVLEGIRNPRDFLSLFDTRRDRVVVLKIPSSPLRPLSFETEGLAIIEQSIDWLVKCGIMSETSVMKITLNDFLEVEAIADSIVQWRNR